VSSGAAKHQDPRIPFTREERARRCQFGFGQRPTNGWGSGDLPAPWAEGDLVRLVGEVGDDRLRCIEGRWFAGAQYYVVDSAFSVDEGDGWYFRVSGNSPDARSSDRLHVFYEERAEYSEDVNYMAAFELAETADPEGLLRRQQLLLNGWTYTRSPECPHCGRTMP
jgi:hypothetical protein